MRRAAMPFPGAPHHRERRRFPRCQQLRHAYGTRFAYTWVTAKIVVMDPKQQAGVMTIVQSAITKRRGLECDEVANGKGLFATPRMVDDAMIDLRDTQDFIGISLSTCHNNVVRKTKEFGTWRT